MFTGMVGLLETPRENARLLRRANEGVRGLGLLDRSTTTSFRSQRYIGLLQREGKYS